MNLDELEKLAKNDLRLLEKGVTSFSNYKHHVETVLKLIKIIKKAESFKKDFMDQYEGEPMGLELYELFEELD